MQVPSKLELVSTFHWLTLVIIKKCKEVVKSQVYPHTDPTELSGLLATSVSQNMRGYLQPSIDQEETRGCVFFFFQIHTIKIRYVHF